MRKAYEQIAEIIKKIDDSATPALNMTFHLGKLTEEAGELAQSINKLNGRKKKKGETLEQIHDNIEEEAADTMHYGNCNQCRCKI